MFRVIIFIIFLLSILIMYYNVNNIRKISFIENLKINKYLKILIIILILLSLLIFYNFVNFIVIMIHLGIFLLLSKLIIFIIEKVRKKEFKYKNNNIIILGLLVTIIYLGIGTYLCFHIFETKYTIYNDKDVNLRIIEIADSHIGTTFDGDGFYKEMEKLSKIDADLFVIVGDFVDDDTSKRDMIRGCEALSLLKPKYGVYYVFGNHDRGYFNNREYTGDDLVNELKKNNVKVLVDEVIEHDNFYIIGREDKSRNRKTIDELVDGLSNKYKIVLNHQPTDYDNEKDKVDLVLSGHTHGGQLIPLGPIGRLSGNDSEYGLKKINNTYFIVTSGISDWSIHFKTGTKSEYVIIDIKNK